MRMAVRIPRNDREMKRVLAELDRRSLELKRRTNEKLGDESSLEDLYVALREQALDGLTALQWLGKSVRDAAESPSEDLESAEMEIGVTAAIGVLSMVCAAFEAVKRHNAASDDAEPREWEDQNPMYS